MSKSRTSLFVVGAGIAALIGGVTSAVLIPERGYLRSVLINGGLVYIGISATALIVEDRELSVITPAVLVTGGLAGVSALDISAAMTVQAPVIERVLATIPDSEFFDTGGWWWAHAVLGLGGGFVLAAAESRRDQAVAGGVLAVAIFPLVAELFVVLQRGSIQGLWPPSLNAAVPAASVTFLLAIPLYRLGTTHRATDTSSLARGRLIAGAVVCGLQATAIGTVITFIVLEVPATFPLVGVVLSMGLPVLYYLVSGRETILDVLAAVDASGTR